MIKKFLTTVLFIVFLLPQAGAKSSGTITKANKYYTSGKYEQAVSEYQKILSKNNTNAKAYEGIIKSYSAFGDKYLGEKEYLKASIKYRSALFYIHIYNQKNSDNIFESSEKHLTDLYKKCMKSLKITTNPKSHYQMARLLYSIDETSAAGYEFSQILKNPKYRTESINTIKEISNELNLN